MVVGIILFGKETFAQRLLVDDKHFPDKALRRAIELEADVDYDSWREGENGEFSDEEWYYYVDIDEITNLEIFDVISDLKGIELIENLSSLYIEEYAGKKLSLENKMLKELEINGFTVSNAKVELILPNVTKLELSGKYKTLNVVEITASQLRELSLWYSSNTIFQCENLPELTSLSICHKKSNVVDVSKYKKLKSLVVYDSEVEQIKGLEQLGNLESASCCGNKIKKLDFSHNSRLLHLECSGNKLLSLKLPASIKELHASTNSLSTLNLSNCKNLTILNVGNNKLKSLNIKNCKKLKEICVYGNKNLVRLNIFNNKNLSRLNVEYTGIKTLKTDTNKKLTTLSCYNTKIKSLDLKKNTKLTALYCYSTKIKKLNLKKNKKLKTIAFDPDILKNANLKKFKTLTMRIRIKKGKTVSLKKYIGLGYNIVYQSNNLQYNKNKCTIKLSKKGLGYGSIELKKGKSRRYILVSGK